MSRYLVKKTCTWYNDLYQYLHFFEFVGLSWLPKEYELTNDLKSWLSVPWIDNPISRHVKENKYNKLLYKTVIVKKICIYIAFPAIMD